MPSSKEKKSFLCRSDAAIIEFRFQPKAFSISALPPRFFYQRYLPCTLQIYAWELLHHENLYFWQYFFYTKYCQKYNFSKVLLTGTKDWYFGLLLWTVFTTKRIYMPLGQWKYMGNITPRKVVFLALNTFAVYLRNNSKVRLNMIGITFESCSWLFLVNLRGPYILMLSNSIFACYEFQFLLNPFWKTGLNFVHFWWDKKLLKWNGDITHTQVVKIQWPKKSHPSFHW